MSPDYKRNLRKETSKMKIFFRESFAKVPRSIRESSTSADKPMGLRNNIIFFRFIIFLIIHLRQRLGVLQKDEFVPTQGWVSHSYAFDKKIPPKCCTLWSAKVFDWSRERLAKVIFLSAKMVICGTRNPDQPPYIYIYIYIHMGVSINGDIKMVGL